MKKYTIICVLLLLTLCGCGKSELSLPKITYTEKEAYYPSFYSGESVPVQNSYIAAVKTELKVMDEGFRADAAAAIGNTVLAADLDSENYQTVMCNLEFDENGSPIVSERIILFSTDNSTADYTDYLYSITAGQDGFYVLSGEAPHKSMKKAEDGDYSIIENTEYYGRYEILKVNTDGNILSSVSVTSLPADSVCDMWAVSEDRVYISAAKCMEDEKFVYLDDFVLYELSMKDGITRSIDFKSGDVPTDILFTANGNYIAVANEERVKLHKFDVENFVIGAAVPSSVYRDYFGRSSSFNREIILPSMMDFVIYNVDGNSLTPILTRTDGDIGWHENCTVILFDESTVICASRGSERLYVYRLP